MMPVGIDAFLGSTSCASPGVGRAPNKWEEGYNDLVLLRPVDAW